MGGGGRGGDNEQQPMDPGQQGLAQQPLQQDPQQQQQPCQWEVQQFLNCAQTQSDLSYCDGFNEALRQCKQRYENAGEYTVLHHTSVVQTLNYQCYDHQYCLSS